MDLNAETSGTLRRASPAVSWTGLTSDEAASRLEADGTNELAREKQRPAWFALLAQFKSPLVVLLIGACALSAALGELVDAIAIAAIVVVNSLVGFIQEHRAERAVLALRSMTAPRARVQRGDSSMVISAALVVRGDVLLLEAGDVVSADARLVEAHALSTNEAALTGESAPVLKRTTEVAPDASLAERTDHVFMGTAVTAGMGRAVVVKTGMSTELGRIAHLLATTQEPVTPLQRQLGRVGTLLLWICLGIVFVVAALGLLHGQNALEVLVSAVSLAVAAVPEGLPAVVTIALAVGVQRMASRNALIRRLAAVETLGSATVICTDKTGTLTTGVMTTREVWGADHTEVIAVAAASCDAELNVDGQGGIGDPTEVALLRAARDRRVERAQIESSNPRVHVNPFDSDRKLMSILRADGVLYTKGALESILARSTSVPDGTQREAAQMAATGLRVLAIATGSGPEEQGLKVVGLVGLADPPRTEATAAVAEARRAGIRTVMITGDHPVTAQAIAREMGILAPGEPPEERVHARATPEEKLRIVRGWKEQGEVVAMTGDGVNDAPALREAHIGVAMGRTGTEVTREAADIVLADDNFATIIAAVREGRGIFDNIRKTLVYLLAGNAAELMLMVLAAAIGLPLPLLPLHLLWINLVTDGIPALALVVDPPDRDVMSRPPRDPAQPMLGMREWGTILLTGALQAGVVFAVFIWALSSRDLAEARNLAFSTLVFGELFRAFAARSGTKLFWEVGAFTNLRLLGVVAVSVLVQLGLHHIPATQALFQIGALSLADCVLSVVLGLIPVTVIELSKLARRLVPARGPLPAHRRA